MLSENKIIKMSRMAMFDKGKKRTCLKISSYYKKDYVTLQTIMTLLWSTLGYAILAAIYVVVQAEELIYDISIDMLTEIGILLGGGYCIVLVLFTGIAIFYYTWKYQNALKVSREYYRTLKQLSTEYRREV